MAGTLPGHCFVLGKGVCADQYASNCSVGRPVVTSVRPRGSTESVVRCLAVVVSIEATAAMRTVRTTMLKKIRMGCSFQGCRRVLGSRRIDARSFTFAGDEVPIP